MPKFLDCLVEQGNPTTAITVAIEITKPVKTDVKLVTAYSHKSILKPIGKRSYIEHIFRNEGVGGSSPPVSTIVLNAWVSRE